MSKSSKRRRSIEIKESSIQALKQASIVRFEGKKTHTEVASMIFDGRTGPVSGGEGDRHKSVSMTEEMFLAIKCRADRIGKSIRLTANDLIIGHTPPLSIEEIAAGVDLANQREMNREMARTKVSAKSESSNTVEIAQDTIKENSSVDDIPPGGIVYF